AVASAPLSHGLEGAANWPCERGHSYSVSRLGVVRFIKQPDPVLQRFRSRQLDPLLFLDRLGALDSQRCSDIAAPGVRGGHHPCAYPGYRSAHTELEGDLQFDGCDWLAVQKQVYRRLLAHGDPVGC